jgi:hypothetical protein
MTTRTSGLALALTLAAGFTAHAGPAFRTVVLSGAAAPGLPAGTTFDFFSDPRLSSGGTVAFWADVAGPGITTANNGSVWSERTGSLAIAYREGDLSGEGPTTVWAALPGPTFFGANRIGFTGSLLDTTQTNQPVNLGIFAEDAGFVLRKTAREGEPLPPPLSTFNWANLPQASMHGGGQIAFSIGTSVWAAGAGQTPALLAQTGAIPPGGGPLQLGFFDQPAQGSGAGSGGVLVRASLTDPAQPGNPPVGTGLFQSIGGVLSQVATHQTPAPGTTANFTEFAIHPTIDAQGRMAFWARLFGIGVNTENDEGIWSGTAGSLTLRVREGDQAAGCEAGTVYSSIGRHPAQSGNTDLAFTARLLGATLSASNNSGLWTVASGGLPLLTAREGSQAPRLPAGTLFAGFSEPFLTEGGQLAFMARLTGTGVAPANNQVLYMTDPTGRLYPVVRTGDLFDVGSGPARLVDEIIFDSEPSGRTQLVDSAAGATAILKLVFRDPAVPPGEAYSSAVVTATLGCLADIDGSGAVNILDFGAFINRFSAGDLRACDFSGNGLLDINDFGGFLNATQTPCP